jgi:PTS system nitrogen regulatory IIA component
MLKDLNSYAKKGQFVSIHKYLDPELVVFLDEIPFTRLDQEEESVDSAIEKLVNALDQNGKLRDRGRFHKAILDRESLVSTGIGLNTAIPHAKIEGYEDFFIVIGIKREPGINWKTIDHSQVRLIFMIGGPDDRERQTEYLKILSHLTEAIMDQTRRAAMLNATSANQIIELF